jgi:hypothetical protein
MYSNADIDSLSVGQLRKLLKGGAVRVRCGSGMKVGLSAPQHKKLMSAHKKGKMMTLTMDPYQMEMHGQGLFGDIGNFFSRKVPSLLIHQGLPEAGAVIGSAGGSYLGGPMGSIVGSELGRRGGERLAAETGRRTGYGVKKGRGQPIEDQQFSLSDVARTGKRLFGRGQPIEDQQFSLSDIARTGKRLFGRGQPIEDQQFSLSDVARTGKRLFGRGNSNSSLAKDKKKQEERRKSKKVEVEKASEKLTEIREAPSVFERLADQYDQFEDLPGRAEQLGKGLKRGRKGQGIVGDAMKMLVPKAKALAKEVGMKLAKKAGRKALNELPRASEQLGEMAGDYVGIAGGKDMGRVLGQMAEKEIAARTGLGMRLKGKYGGALLVAGVR